MQKEKEENGQRAPRRKKSRDTEENTSSCLIVCKKVKQGVGEGGSVSEISPRSVENLI